MIYSRHTRQAIFEAYALHLKSKGFEINDVRVPGKRDADRLIWNAKEAGKVIACVERLPDHLKSWIYFAYTPLGDTNQAWEKRCAVQKQVKKWRNEADRKADEAAGLPARIKKCKTEVRRAELSAINTDKLLVDAAELEKQADNLERSLKFDYCAPFWNWLDELIAAHAPAKMRKKTVLHVRDVCRATAYNYRHKVVASVNKPLVERKEICDRFGVPVSNFEHTYRRWVGWTLDVCEWLDNESLDCR